VARYYDSLTLFSPARFSALPGLPVPGDPRGYPARDEMARYLRDYAVHFGLPVRTQARVTRAEWDEGGYPVTLAGGDQLRARAPIGASGGFGTGYRASTASARPPSAAPARGPRSAASTRAGSSGAGPLWPVVRRVHATFG
jgi:putative flavoprotein involved in K+ transport